MRDVEYRELSFAPAYRVGSDGSVWSRRNARWGFGEWRRLRGWLDGSGYRCYGLMLPDAKAGRTYRGHVLVMLAFRGERPAGMDICHANGDPADNRLTNLRYDTRRENIADAQRAGTFRCKRERTTEGR